MTSVTKDGTTTTFTYDSFNRRLSTSQGWNTFFFLWDDQDEIGKSINGLLTELRVLGEGLGAEIGSATFLEINQQVHIPIHDHRGALTCLLYNDGSPHETYRYTAFGEELTGNTISPWRFASKRVDPETGYIYFGRRYYSPTLGKWISPDPIGYKDGPNLYAYVHNCPLTAIDLYGLKEYLPNHFGECARNPFCVPSRPLLFSSNLPSEFGLTFESGFKNRSRPYDLKKYQRPELPGGKGIFFVNGMNNSFSEAQSHALYLSDLSGGHNVRGVYNATHGKFADLYECGIGLRGTRTDPVQFIHKQWDSFFDHASLDRLALHFCTSQGAILTKNALLDYPEDRRNRIRVVGVAPAAYINDDICHSVQNYEAKWYRDPVPRISVWERWKNRSSIQVVPSHPSASFFDHSFSSPTYRQFIEQRN